MNWLKIGVVASALASIAAPVAAQNANDAAAFIDAVRKSDGDAATKLLNARGASIINDRDYGGQTALVVAITARSEQWTAFLLNNGADPNLSGEHGDTPLIAAARVGYEDAVGWLLGQGAKVDGTNKMGETPLIIAVQQREPHIVKLLLASGANPDKTDSAAGLSARDYAIRDTRSRDILQMIQSAKPAASASSAAH
jgi:ankyrin repeat protein